MSSISSNGDDGAQIDDATLDLSDSTVEDNTSRGLHFFGDADGDVRQNQIRDNGQEGVGMYTDSSGSPSPTIQFNNIYTNATTGSTSVEVIDPSGTLSASFTCCNSSGTTSSTYTAPAGKEIRRAYVSFNDGTNSSSVDGYLIDGTSGATLRSFENDFNGWVYLDPGTTALRVRVRDSGSSYTVDDITVTQLELVELDATASYEMMVSTDSGTTTAKFNYWTPTIGDVPNRIYERRASSSDYTGFTGIEYTDAGPRP